jgi:hypothetical protein
MNDKLINPIWGMLIGAGRHCILKVYLEALYVFGTLIFHSEFDLRKMKKESITMPLF